MQNGVQGHEHFRAVAMGKRHQPGDIAQAVAGVVAGAKARSADVDGIRAVKDRFTGDPASRAGLKVQDDGCAGAYARRYPL
jgi:hypothetical protein